MVHYARMGMRPEACNRPDLDTQTVGVQMSEQDSTEEWRAIPGWEGVYEVSDHGRVCSVERSIPIRDFFRKLERRVLKNKQRPLGYEAVMLHRRGGYVNKRVPRLVLEAFVGPCPTGEECRHLDGDPSNNRLSNLAWGTPKENAADCTRHGTRRRGVAVFGAKLTPDAVRAIRASSDSLSVLGRRYGVDGMTIHEVKHRRSWKHVK